jgi:hypothetical protein
MPATDLPGGAPDPGFVGLAIPARGRLHLCRIFLAPGYADFTPGDGPRRGWPKPVKWVETIDGHHIVWCGERRGVPGLPANPAALTVAMRLGCADLDDQIGLRGDLLLAGIDASGGPADVPQTVVQAAISSGLLCETDRGGVTAGDGCSRRGRPGPPAAVPAGRGHLHDPQSTAVVAEVEAGRCAQDGGCQAVDGSGGRDGAPSAGSCARQLGRS